MVLDGAPEQHQAELQKIAAQLREIMDTDCRFTFCDQIPSEKTGFDSMIKIQGVLPENRQKGSRDGGI